MLAPEDALAVHPIAGKGQTGDAVAFCGDQLPKVQEPEDHIVEALVIHHIHDRSAAAHEQECVIRGEFLPACIARGIVGFQLVAEVGGIEVGPLREPACEIDRIIQPGGLVDRLRGPGEVLIGHHLVQRRVEIAGRHAGRQGVCAPAFRGDERRLITGLIEHLERADEFFTPVPEFG
jgi:hypothetical protein